MAAQAQRSVLREGIAAGLIGAAVVAVWFLAFDAARGRPLLTPALLGAAIFQGLNTPIGLEITAGPVLGYTLLHGLAFVAVGVAAALLIAGAERRPLFVLALVIFFAAFEVFFFGAVVIAAKWVLDTLAGWTIFLGNVLAAATMLAYFFAGHRALARRLTTAWLEED